MTKAEAISQIVPKPHNEVVEAFLWFALFAFCCFAVWYATGWVACYISDRALKWKIRARSSKR